MAGEAGSFMLGNTVAFAPAAGAESGQFEEPRGALDSLISMGAGLGVFVFSTSSSFTLTSSSHPQLRSERAVDGPLSICSPLSFSESSESAVSLLLVLLVLRLLLTVLTVLVRFRADFPVCGGEARAGETMAIPLRKSVYATGGVMGVFWRSCSSLMVALNGAALYGPAEKRALKGPAEGKPADGSAEEGIGSRKADVLETADRGVAEGREVADRSS